jgi:hypothetical protein
MYMAVYEAGKQEGRGVARPGSAQFCCTDLPDRSDPALLNPNLGRVDTLLFNVNEICLYLVAGHKK